MKFCKGCKLVKFGLYQQICVRVEMHSKAAKKQRGYDLLKDDKL